MNLTRHLPILILIASHVSASIGQEPERLAKLRANYLAAVDRAMAPLRNTYTSELERLKAEFTRAADLDAALAVDAELKRLAGPQSDAPKSVATVPLPSPTQAPSPVQGSIGGYTHDGKSLVFLDVTGKSLDQVRGIAKRNKLGLYGFDGHDASPEAMKAAVAALLKGKQSLGIGHHNSWVRIPGLSFKRDGTLLREPEAGGKLQAPVVAANILSQFKPADLDFTNAKDSSGVAYWTHSSGNIFIRVPETAIGGRIALAVFTTTPTALQP